jgi:hypothetical protein
VARLIPMAMVVVTAMLAVPGCECSSTESTATSWDGGEVAPVNEDRHALAGAWSGHVYTRRYGLVTGAISIDDEGKGTGVVTASGMTFSRTVAIDSWDGSYLQVRVGGVAYTIAAELAGSRLVADLPMVGEISLRRK